MEELEMAMEGMALVMAMEESMATMASVKPRLSLRVMPNLGTMEELDMELDMALVMAMEESMATMASVKPSPSTMEELDMAMEGMALVMAMEESMATMASVKPRLSQRVMPSPSTMEELDMEL